MEENFKKFKQYLEMDEALREHNPIVNLSNGWNEGKLNFYEYMNEMQNFHRILKYYAERLPSCEIKKIEISDGEVIFTTRKNGIKLSFNGIDRLAVPIWMLNFGNYEEEEIEIYNQLIEDGMTILDVGANIGYFSILWRIKFPNSTIYAFEPMKDTFNTLKKNIAINNCENVFPLPFALSNKNKNGYFYSSPEMISIASEKNVLDYKKAEKIPISFIKLDFFNIENIDFIKIDAEGSEFNILKGSIESFKKFNPIVVVELFEYWDKVFEYHPDEVIEFLKELGYRSFLPENGKLREVFCHEKGDFAKQNYFFLHSQKHKERILKITN